MTEMPDGKEIAAVWVDIDDVTPWDENPRNNEAAIAPVAASIKRFGFASPLIVRKADNVVIAGHTRLLAARSLGLDRVPVRFMDLDPADARLLAIVDNKSGEVAEWDDDALGALLGDMDDFDLELLLDTGFSEEDLEALLDDGSADPDGERDQGDEDAVAETQAGATVLHGDCVATMAKMEPDSFDSCVCDPPYGIGFMGREWDALPPGKEFSEALHRVLKPGAWGVAFGGQRTIHRLTTSLEDAGFEIRDLFGWQFWSGFPKSHDASKALDRAAGAEREVVGRRKDAQAESTGQYGGWGNDDGSGSSEFDITAPATPDARKWEGWGTALKPCIEPAVIFRKPFEGTVAENVLEYGTGAINIDGCRYPFGDTAWPGPDARKHDAHAKQSPDGATWGGALNRTSWDRSAAMERGRWPANVYACPKVSTRERELGCDGLPMSETTDRRNDHPTLKPVRLLRWLARLVTPPGGKTLDPFAGSGSAGVAAVLEGFDYTGCEIDGNYHKIAKARIGHAQANPEEWSSTEPGAQ